MPIYSWECLPHNLAVVVMTEDRPQTLMMARHQLVPVVAVSAAVFQLLEAVIGSDTTHLVLRGDQMVGVSMLGVAAVYRLALQQAVKVSTATRPHPDPHPDPGLTMLSGMTRRGCVSMRTAAATNAARCSNSPSRCPLAASIQDHASVVHLETLDHHKPPFEALPLSTSMQTTSLLVPATPLPQHPGVY